MPMRPIRSALLLVLVFTLCWPDATAASQLEELGWSAARLKSAGEAAGEGPTHSMLLAHRSGKILWQWGPVEEKLQVFSIRKSLVSALFGIFAARDQVDLDATLAELGIDDKQGLTAQEKQASVRELLAARSGVYHPAAYETPGMARNRPERGAHAHGEHWFYNNWDFNALNTIFEKTTGVKIPAAFRERIAGPAGMQDFRQEDVRYILEDASEYPAVEFWMSGHDLVRFGVLFLNEGRSGGPQVIPADWVRQSTAVHSELGILGGYGYSWWVAHEGEHVPLLKLPDGTFSARGTGEQILLVLPHLDVVWVHRTRVTSPDQKMMHVMESTRLLRKVLDAHEPLTRRMSSGP